MDQVQARRTLSGKRFDELKTYLTKSSALISGKACVYATGSFGRLEASKYSDLDLFILGKSTEGMPLLSRLDGICLQSDLIHATRQFAFPEFSGDGRYLVQYSVSDLTNTLGKPEDDALNTFTARLLLLLESRPLIGEDVYHELIQSVISAYWKDYKDHDSQFVPAFLSNDILRLWRTFCVNYEAGTQREPIEKKAKGKLKNYKLKHSRLLTCYSALLHLLAVSVRNGSVSPSDVLSMVKLTPLERVEHLLRDNVFCGAHVHLKCMLDRYNAFLETTDAPEEKLIDLFKDKKSKRLLEAAYEFGNAVYGALSEIGGHSKFYRLLVV